MYSRVSPSIAASLAEGIYTVQNEMLLKGFMANEIFSVNSQHRVSLKAEVDSRLINTENAFAVCTRGGTGYENDLSIYSCTSAGQFLLFAPFRAYALC